jgi:hypothetical protein
MRPQAKSTATPKYQDVEITRIAKKVHTQNHNGGWTGSSVAKILVQNAADFGLVRLVKRPSLNAALDEGMLSRPSVAAEATLPADRNNFIP